MIKLIIINSVAVFIAAYVLRGVYIKSFITAIGVAILLAIVNTVLKPVLVFLTLPITILTLGLFILVINALLLMLVDALVEGFKIKSFAWAVIMSVVLAIVNWGLHLIF